MKFKICYIDDENEILLMFKDLFETDSIEVVIFNDPEIALQNINQLKPDLMFIDYRLPKMLGDVLASKIDFDVTKVLVTAENPENLKIRFDKIFNKPFNVEEIESYIGQKIKDKK